MENMNYEIEKDFQEKVKSAIGNLDELETTFEKLKKYVEDVQNIINSEGRLFITYEEPFGETIFNEKQMKQIYRIMVNKEEYETFDIWICDMLKSGVFEEFLPQK